MKMLYQRLLSFPPILQSVGGRISKALYLSRVPDVIVSVFQCFIPPILQSVGGRISKALYLSRVPDVIVSVFQCFMQIQIA